MRTARSSALALGVLCGCALAFAQNPHQLQIDDTGQVITAHQRHHARRGDKITWMRQSGSAKTWYVRFTGDSPCAEGKILASGRRASCTVNVACSAAGDAGCKSYHYQSATGRRAKMFDPEIVIDP